MFLGFRQEHETAQDVRGTSALRRPERSGDLEPSRPGGARKHQKDIPPDVFLCFYRARDGTRTRGPDLGKVVLHQLSHSCIYSSVPDGQVILYLMVSILSTTIFKVFQKIEKLLILHFVTVFDSVYSLKRLINPLFGKRSVIYRVENTLISSFKIFRHQNHIGSCL